MRPWLQINQDLAQPTRRSHLEEAQTHVIILSSESQKEYIAFRDHTQLKIPALFPGRHDIHVCVSYRRRWEYSAKKLQARQILVVQLDRVSRSWACEPQSLTVKVPT